MRPAATPSLAHRVWFQWHESNLFIVAYLVPKQLFPATRAHAPPGTPATATPMMQQYDFSPLQISAILTAEKTEKLTTHGAFILC